MFRMSGVYTWPSTADRSNFNKSVCPAPSPPIKILSKQYSRENLMFHNWLYLPNGMRITGKYQSQETFQGSTVALLLSRK